MIRATIVGASGYAGGELLRLLLGHPEVEVKQITSERYAGQYAYFVHPNLRGRTSLRFIRLERLEACDLLFLALPHCQAMYRIEEFASLAERIVDLSADFRLKDPAAYVEWYGVEHPAPEWLARFVYGLPELHREELKGARYISGVGCNAACVIIALWPLYRRGLVKETVVEVKVGSSEGGSKPTTASHHPERSNVVRSYAPTRHRHLAELIQELDFSEIANAHRPASQVIEHLESPTGARKEVHIHLSITSVGMVRGALATCHCFLQEKLEGKELWRIYRDAYRDEPFVRLVKVRRGVHRYPEPKIVSGSNYCDIGFEPDREGNRLVVIAALDNLMKGAAGNAVQVMNVMYGLPETMGLEFTGLHPI